MTDETSVAAGESPPDNTEDEAPQSGDVAQLLEPTPPPTTAQAAFTENVKPGSAAPVREVEKKPTVTDLTRQVIAYSLVGLVALLSIAGTGALIASNWTNFKTDQLKELTIFLSPIITLASAAFGFYFGSSSTKDP
ncbi:hypothetical protein [Streptomyces hokutonensis]|uniref:hypothetical protein n=1 Tax=Streptomyces hokutonensis TaxID=1306990 RepID=UPI00380AE080